MTQEEIIEVIHKTMYQFFDVCGDNEEVPMSDKDELLLSVNKAICNNIKALEQPCEDAVSRKANELIAEIESQEKWLLQAGYDAYNVDIALDSIKRQIRKEFLGNGSN